MEVGASLGSIQSLADIDSNNFCDSYSLTFKSSHNICEMVEWEAMKEHLDLHKWGVADRYFILHICPQNINIKERLYKLLC